MENTRMPFKKEQVAKIAKYSGFRYYEIPKESALYGYGAVKICPCPRCGKNPKSQVVKTSYHTFASSRVTIIECPCCRIKVTGTDPVDAMTKWTEAYEQTVTDYAKRAFDIMHSDVWKKYAARSSEVLPSVEGVVNLHHHIILLAWGYHPDPNILKPDGQRREVCVCIDCGLDNAEGRFKYVNFYEEFMRNSKAFIEKYYKKQAKL